MVSGKLDTSEWMQSLNKLNGELKEKLAHSMAVAAAKDLAAEARFHTPVGPTGILARSIFYDWNERESTKTLIKYKVSWNTKTAAHGHLIEFGHWQPYTVVRIDAEIWISTKNLRKDGPKWIPAHPFIRPAFEAGKARAMKAMIDRAKVRLPELLRGDP